ncbi:hypothetical protein DNTS_011938 [Danionella cerebrum]|uniref:PX domain-containing protein n=1 Tax=Danionella cerebrum TaxID=2873325 RepID=A0A553Q7P4_9TELE|nr:hypothetical protein DNTS_011938 [Danionella translucida]
MKTNQISLLFSQQSHHLYHTDLLILSLTPNQRAEIDREIETRAVPLQPLSGEVLEKVLEFGVLPGSVWRKLVLQGLMGYLPLPISIQPRDGRLISYTHLISSEHVNKAPAASTDQSYSRRVERDEQSKRYQCPGRVYQISLYSPSGDLHVLLNAYEDFQISPKGKVSRLEASSRLRVALLEGEGETEQSKVLTCSLRSSFILKDLLIFMEKNQELHIITSPAPHQEMLINTGEETDGRFDASCLTTAELQQHWRAVKQEIRRVELLFDIPSAKVIDKTISKYVVYTVVVLRSGSYDSEQVEIWRRYSDFLHLHQQLLLEFREEIEDVAMPKKKLTGNLCPEIITERRVALRDYLTQLYSLRCVRKSKAFQDFFTHQELKTAYILLRGGRFLQALEGLQKVLILQEKLASDDPTLVVPTLCAILVCQRDLQDFEAALQTGRRALPTVRRYELFRYQGPLLEMLVDLGYSLGLPVAQIQEELRRVQDSLYGQGSQMSLKELVVQEFFMQRGLDAEQKQQLDEEERRIISDEHWFLDLPELKAKENHIIEERSFVPCEDLVYGRMSFKGFNPEVEKLMITMNAPREEDEEEDEEDMSRMEMDITDEEMAKRYETLVESMRKKFAKKRERSASASRGEDVNCNVITDVQPKRAFLKPQD